jgi:hypothetical protein
VADVFVSYAPEDLPFVCRLTAALQARNRKVWGDLADIMPSARWREEIRTAITEADARLHCWCQHRLLPDAADADPAALARSSE